MHGLYSIKKGKILLCKINGNINNLGRLLTIISTTKFKF